MCVLLPAQTQHSNPHSIGSLHYYTDAAPLGYCGGLIIIIIIILESPYFTLKGMETWTRASKLTNYNHMITIMVKLLFTHFLLLHLVIYLNFMFMSVETFAFIKHR